MPNVATSCQCGWVGIAPTYTASTADHLFHQLSEGEGHSAITHTNVPELMNHPELSILRQVASQDAMDYRALHMVKGREEFRLRRAGDMMAPLFVEDDGLGCARGCISASAIVAGLVSIVAGIWAIWFR
jgi:hypothetical protein